MDGIPTVTSGFGEERPAEAPFPHLLFTSLENGKVSDLLNLLSHVCLFRLIENLTLCQTTKFRLVQIESICRQ